jgi:hypothetical protein
MAQIEVTDPNASGNTAQKIKRVRGLSLDANTAALVVSMADASGNTVTSLKTTAGGPGAGQAAKNYSGLVTLTGSAQTIAIETVTAGRTYYISDIVATSTNASAILLQIQAAGAPIFQAHINATKGIEALGIETQPFAATGQAVTLVIPSGSGQVAFNIFGYEQ